MVSLRSSRSKSSNSNVCSKKSLEGKDQVPIEPKKRKLLSKSNIDKKSTLLSRRKDDKKVTNISPKNLALSTNNLSSAKTKRRFTRSGESSEDMKASELYPSPPLSSSLKPNENTVSRQMKKSVSNLRPNEPKTSEPTSCSLHGSRGRGRPPKISIPCNCAASKKASISKTSSVTTKKKSVTVKKTASNAKSIKKISNVSTKKKTKTTSRGQTESSASSVVKPALKKNMRSPKSKRPIEETSEKLEEPKFKFSSDKSNKSIGAPNNSKESPSNSTAEFSSNCSLVSPKKAPAMSEYELKRLALINQNRLFLESLNLGTGAGFSLSALSEPAASKPPAKIIKPPSFKKKSEVDYPLRKSRRLEGKPASPLPYRRSTRLEKSVEKEFDSDSDDIVTPRKNPNPRTTKMNRKGGHKRKLFTHKKLAPQELPIEDKQEILLEAQKKSFKKVAMPQEQGLDLSNLKDLHLGVHRLSDCPDDICLKDDHYAEIMNHMSQLHEATPQPVKLIGDISTALDVHSDPQRFVLAMGNRSGEVAVWDATDIVLCKGAEGMDKKGYLHQGASVLHHQADKSRVWSLKFQPEYSAKLLQTNGDGSLRAYDIHREILAPVCQLPITGEYMTALDFSDPHTATFTTSYGFLGHHDLRTASHATNLKALNDTTHLLWCLAVNPVNPNIIAVGSSDRTLSLWDTRYLSDRKPIVEQHYNAFVTSLDWDSRGKRLAMLAYDDFLRVFDASQIKGNSTVESFDESSFKITAHHFHDADPWRKGVPLQARFHPDPDLDGQVVVCGAITPKLNYYHSTSNRSLGCFPGGHFPAASPAMLAFHPAAKIGSHPFGSGLVGGTLSGRAFILC